jgi:hypothetical protein
MLLALNTGLGTLQLVGFVPGVGELLRRKVRSPMRCSQENLRSRWSGPMANRPCVIQSQPHVQLRVRSFLLMRDACEGVRAPAPDDAGPRVRPQTD